MPKPNWPLILLGLGGLAFVVLTRDERSQVTRAARGELGESNGGKYWADTLPAGTPTLDYPKDWCGGFVLWAIHQAGLGQDIHWKTGLGFLSGHLTTTNDPKPGDIAYFNHNEHHAIVDTVTGDTVTLINGNGIGGKVTPSTVRKSDVTAFYSIESLLDKKAVLTS